MESTIQYIKYIINKNRIVFRHLHLTNDLLFFITSRHEREVYKINGVINIQKTLYIIPGMIRRRYNHARHNHAKKEVPIRRRIL